MIHSGHREHPVRQLLDSVAAGAPVPCAAELEELPVADDATPRQAVDFRTRVRRAAEEIAELRAAGAHGQARRAAVEAAHSLHGLAGDPNTGPDPTDGLSPAELARLVPRGAEPAAPLPPRQPAPFDLDARVDQILANRHGV